MKTDELTKKVNQQIDTINNRTNLLVRGGCLGILRKDLEKIGVDVRDLILLIDDIEKGEVTDEKLK